MPPLLVPADCGTIHLRTSCTPSPACEVLTRGELTRLQAATSAALAIYNQTI